MAVPGEDVAAHPERLQHSPRAQAGDAQRRLRDPRVAQGIFLSAATGVVEGRDRIEVVAQSRRLWLRGNDRGAASGEGSITLR